MSKDFGHILYASPPPLPFRRLIYDPHRPDCRIGYDRLKDIDRPLGLRLLTSSQICCALTGLMGRFSNLSGCSPRVTEEHAYTWAAGVSTDTCATSYAKPCALAFCELTKKTGGMWMTYGEVLYLCWGWDVSVVGGAMV